MGTAIALTLLPDQLAEIAAVERAARRDPGDFSPSSHEDRAVFWFERDRFHPAALGAVRLLPQFDRVSGTAWLNRVDDAAREAARPEPAVGLFASP